MQAIIFYDYFFIFQIICETLIKKFSFLLITM